MIDKSVDFDEYYEEDTLKDRFMSFKVNNIQYALELSLITEIISVQKITEIPNVKNFIIGIINLRGSIIPIVSLRRRFNLEQIPYNEKTCIIVVNYDNHNVGLLVDEVSEVLSIPQDLIENPPITNKGFESKFILGIGKINDKFVTLLRIYDLLFDIDG
jgi:purine-binding chemotaxis protein CheW